MHYLVTFLRSTAASQQEGRGFKSRMVQHVGACSRAFLCGVCMFSPCYPGSPRRTPTIKTCKKSRCSSVLTLTKSGPSTWTWSPGAASLAAHCSWMSLGEDSRMGKSREHLPPSCMCMCVCVPCCVAIKRACPPDFISTSLTERKFHEEFKYGIKFDIGSGTKILYLDFEDHKNEFLQGPYLFPPLFPSVTLQHI